MVSGVMAGGRGHGNFPTAGSPTWRGLIQVRFLQVLQVLFSSIHTSRSRRFLDGDLGHLESDDLVRDFQRRAKWTYRGRSGTAGFAGRKPMRVQTPTHLPVGDTSALLIVVVTGAATSAGGI